MRLQMPDQGRGVPRGLGVALEQGYARLEAMLVDRAGQTRPIEVSGDLVLDEEPVDPELAKFLLREHKRGLAGLAGQGAQPRAADWSEVEAYFIARLKALKVRIGEETRVESDGPPPPLGEAERSPLPVPGRSQAVSAPLPGWLRALVTLDDEQLRRMLRNMPAPLRRRFFEEWRWQAHEGQHEPGGDWKVWLMMAGRGFGKTRAGAEWISAKARTLPGARLALVGGTIDDVVKVMIEGESGLMAVARTGERPRWMPSRGLLIFPSGALGLAYSGERPDKLRGPQHHFAWCDEIAKWAHGQECWDNLMLGLRLGERPRAVVTTTPRPVPVLKAIIGLERTARTGGRTQDNIHLASDFRETVTAMYGGTRLGRQELAGELVEDIEGALWTRELIEACRSFDTPFRQSSTATQDERQFFSRIVVGVDPPASVEGICGIVVAGIDAEGTGWVVEDASAGGLSPDGWAERVCAAAERWGADKVVAEANQGGLMVESVLRAIERDLPLVLRHARDAKGKRAEPVHALFERGRVKLAGCFPEMEDQLAGLMPGGGYEGPGRSPDRADAMVWAVSELMLGRRNSEPRVVAL